MNRAEIFIEYYELMHNVIKLQLNGITHEESLIQPPSRGNCLNWVLGHIVYSRATVLQNLDEALPWTAEDSNRYLRNAEPIVRAEQALPFEQLLKALEESQACLLAGLRRVSPGRLEEDAGGQTRGKQIAFAQWHETYHIGQLEQLRQLAGKNDKVI